MKLIRPAGLSRGLLIAGLCLGAQSGRATTVLPPDFSELVNESDYIVHAVVKSVDAQVQVTANGRKIYTYVELQVTEVVAGQPPNPLILRVLGGRVGQEEMILQGAPKFTVGQEGIFFVQGNGRQIFPLVRIMHGLYPIQTEPGTKRKFISRSNRVPLQSTAQVALPMAEGSAAQLQDRFASTAQALSPEQFKAEIRAAVKSDNSRLHREP